MWIERYKSGNYVEVWSEICGKGILSRKSDDREGDVSVANEIMERAATNIERIIETLFKNSWQFAYPAFVHSPPTQQDLDAIEEIEAKIGALPLALTSCLSIIGGVSLCGSHPDFSIPTYLFDDATVALLADPLVLPTASWLLTELDEILSEELNTNDAITFAPDEYHKANYSGGSHYIKLLDSGMDPQIFNILGRPNISLVEYLRVSMSWGGFPGFEFLQVEDVPPLISLLQQGLLFF